MATINSINVATGATGTVLTGQGVGVTPLFSGSVILSSIVFSPSTSGIFGTITNNNATTGFVGEFVSSVIATASAVATTVNTATNITSISLTAGDWDVWGNVTLVTKVTNITQFLGWVSSTSATLPDSSLYGNFSLVDADKIATASGVCAPQLRFSLAATTTIYLSSQQAGSAGAGSVCGGIYARRAR